MTAKEQLIEAMAMAYEWHDMLAGAGPIITDPEVRIQHYKNRARSALGAALGMTDDLLAVLAETGVLSTEYRKRGSSVDVRERYVSPWVPSGDQT